jgi:hypothetical protein
MEFKKIYFTTINGNVINNFGLARLAMLRDGEYITSNDYDRLREYAETCKGIIKEIENPSVEHLLRCGYRSSAINVYKDKHPELSYMAVRNAIDRIEYKMKNRKKDTDNMDTDNMDSEK